MSNSIINVTLGYGRGSGLGLLAGFFQKKAGEERHATIMFSEYAMGYILEGSGVCLYDGAEYPFGPGCMIQRFPDELTEVVFDTEKKMTLAGLHIPVHLYNVLEDNGVILRDSVVKDIGYHPHLIDSFTSLMELYYRKPAAPDYYLLSESFKLAGELHYLAEQGPELPEEIAAAADLLCNFSLSVPDVARMVGMSNSHFRRRFGHEMGVSPKVYQQQRRIKQAQSMLCEGKYTIGEVADKLSFSDQYSFSKQFKKISGMSPSEFKGQIF